VSARTVLLWAQLYVGGGNGENDGKISLLRSGCRNKLAVEDVASFHET
jgi:hypothetical protein